jgi:hypothetical protein
VLYVAGVSSTSSELVEALLLLLVPVVLGAPAHPSPEMPLQQYWAAVSFGTDSIDSTMGSCLIRISTAWLDVQRCAVCGLGVSSRQWNCRGPAAAAAASGACAAAAAGTSAPEMPCLWPLCLQDPAGGGLSPAAIIASYVTYPYATHCDLNLLAVEALNAFAILQVQCMLSCGRFLCAIFFSTCRCWL